MNPSVVAKHALRESTVPVHKIQSCFTIYVVESLNLFHARMEMQQFVAFLSDEADMPIGCTSQTSGFLELSQSYTNLVQFFLY